MIYFYNRFSKTSSKTTAMNLYKDGAGYYITAKTWVPFVKPGRAFVLYLCWEQENLRGNEVILEKLEDNEAIVCIKKYNLLQAVHTNFSLERSDFN